MPACYELAANDKGQFSFVLKAANGEVILRSQQYAGKPNALAGIASVQTNGLMDEHFEALTASDGRAYFNLKAGNGQVIGTSQMYASTAGRDNGIASVKTNAGTTQINGA